MYDVYINLELKATAVSIDRAWEIVGESAFGSGYMITYTGTNNCVPDTVPY